MSATQAGRRPHAAAWHGLEELRGALRAFLGRHCSDENDIEDVIQETFVRAARYRSSRGGVVKLKPWTRRIALNVLSDWRRRSSRCPFQSLDGEELAAPSQVDDEPAAAFRLGRWQVEAGQALHLVHGALPELQAQDRELLDRYYRDQGSLRAAGAAAGVPPHLAKVRLYRARQKLLRALRRRVALGAARSVVG